MNRFRIRIIQPAFALPLTDALARSLCDRGLCDLATLYLSYNSNVDAALNALNIVSELN